MKVKAMAGILSLAGFLVAGSASAAEGNSSNAGETHQSQALELTTLSSRERLQQQTHNGNAVGKQQRFRYLHQHRRQTGGGRMNRESDGMEGGGRGSGRH